MSQNLLFASHPDPAAYWLGGSYILNMAFGALRKRQWERLIPALWNFPALHGPFAAPALPSQLPVSETVTLPAPRSTQMWFGNLDVDSFRVGCTVQAVRTKSACVRIEIPLGMFENNGSELDENHLEPVKQRFQELALAVFKTRPFDLATIGFQPECPVMTELLTDTRQWLSLLAKGNFFIRNEMLALLGYSAESFYPVSPEFCWIEPGR